MNTDDPAAARHQIASRIHDLLRRETGQEIDTALMLGPRPAATLKALVRD